MDDLLQQMIDAGLAPQRADILAAQMKRGQGLMATPGAQGMNVGGTYVAASPLEHLASAMSRIMGGRQVKGAEQGMQDLIGQQRTARMAYGQSLEQPQQVPAAQAPSIPPLLAKPQDAFAPPDFAPQAPQAPGLVAPRPQGMSPTLAALSGDPAIMAAAQAQVRAAQAAQEAGFKERELGQGDRRLAQQGEAQAAENAYRTAALGETRRHNQADETQGRYAGFNADSGQPYVIDQRTGQAVPLGGTAAPGGPYAGKAGKMQLDKETELRKELQGLQTYKDTQQVAAAYRKISSASESGAGDMSLIFGYMKLLDPNSTVREGEYATAANAGSAGDKMISLYNRVLNGEKLSPDVRKQFHDEAKRVYDAQMSRWEVTSKPYKDLAVRYGIDPQNVILPFGDAPIAGPTSGGMPIRVSTLDEARALPSGTRFVDPNGVERVR